LLKITDKIIQGNGDLYWNRGMHKAWTIAHKVYDYDLYLWLNDDTFLFENSLQLLISANINTNGESIIVGSTCSQKDRTTTYGGFLLPDTLINPNGKLQKCDFFNGNCVLVPSKVFKELGNLDPIFHHSLGDIDYGLRAKRKGISAYIVNEFVGYCERHEVNPICFNSSYNTLRRFKHLYSPLGNNPFEFFVFDNRHFSFLSALKHFFTLHLRTLIPSIWQKKLIR